MASVDSEKSLPKNGERFQIGKFKGTVKFFGILPNVNKTTQYVGVEWDDPTRGKHNGSAKDVKYFSTRGNKNSGSFLKFKAFKGKTKTPNDFLFALKERYEQSKSGNDSFKPENNGDIVIEDNGGNKICVEFVGKDKVEKRLSDLKRLTKVGLEGMLIGMVNEGIGKVLSGVRELDLSRNLLWNWDKEIVLLCKEFTKLTSLVLSENIFSFGKDVVKKEMMFENLKTLVLNKCCLSFSDILRIEKFFPKLKELHACSNELKDFALNDDEKVKKDCFVNLEKLILIDNKIERFEDVVKHFSGLQSLKHLILSKNQISVIREFKKGDFFFNKLEELIINDNLIDSYESISNIDLNFPSLKQLIIFNNPVEKAKAPITCRSMIISKIKNLEILNRSIISRIERNDAEKYYVKNFIDIEKGTKRIKELAKKHFEYVEILRETKLGKVKKKKDIVKVILKYLTEGKEKKKRLKLSMEIKQLKVLCKRLWKLDEELQDLYLLGKDGREIRIGADDHRMISYFGIWNGTVIFLKKKDLKEEKEKEEISKKKFMEELKKHQEDIDKNLEWKKDLLSQPM